MPNALKLHFVENFSEGDTDKQLVAMKKVFEFVDNPQRADIIYCGSISKMNEAENMKRPGAKLVTYCWDYYKWAHEGQHHTHNWRQYARFLSLCDLILVPSTAQQKRLKELLDLDSKVVHTGIPVFEHEVSDNRFVLDPVRFYPEENRNWVIDACNELGIPVIHSEHQYNRDQFEELVATCSFLTCGFREASTGGLSLMEGLWLGKPSLVSDSPYMGAADYLGAYGTYFRFDDFANLKQQLKKMWDNPPKIEVAAARDYINSKFSYDRMAERIKEEIHAIL